MNTCLEPTPALRQGFLASKSDAIHVSGILMELLSRAHDEIRTMLPNQIISIRLLC